METGFLILMAAVCILLALLMFFKSRTHRREYRRLESLLHRGLVDYQAVNESARDFYEVLLGLFFFCGGAAFCLYKLLAG